MILTEHFMNVVRSQTSSKAGKPPYNWIGQKRKEKEIGRERHQHGASTPESKL